MAETGQPTRPTPGGAGMGGSTTGSPSGAGTGGTGPGSMTGGGAGMGGSSTGGSGPSGAGAGGSGLGAGGGSGMGSTPGRPGTGGSGAGGSPGGMGGSGGAGAGGSSGGMGGSGTGSGSAGARTGTGSTGGGSGGSGAAQPGDLKSIASDVASEIANTATEQGRGLLQAARGSATSFVDQRKDTAAQSIADLASSLRDSGKGFEEQPSLKAFVGTAADGLEQLATGLRERSFGDIYGDVEAMARRQPVTFAAGAAIAGFLLARFIKSSAEEMAENNAARARSVQAGGTSRAAGRPHAPAGGAGVARG